MTTADFETKTIEEVIEILIDYRGKTPLKAKEGIKLITAKVIKDGWILEGNHEYITEETYKFWMTRGFPQKGDVLITTEAPLGEVALLRTSEKVALAQRVILLRGKPKILSQEYLLYALKTLFVQRQLYERAASTTVLGIKQSELIQVKIPLPPLAEQKRIAAILEKCDRLRRTRRYTLQLSDTFLQSVFLEMFGDPVTNPMGWEVMELSLLGQLDRGRSKHRPRNAPELFGGYYPFIQTGDVANSSGYIRTYKQTYSEQGFKQSKLWSKGTLCITIAANIAKTGILTFDACFPDSIVGFVPNKKTNTEFIQQWFSFIQQNLEDTAPESAQKNINLEILRGLGVPLPPLPLQEKFAQIVQKYERLRTQQRESDRQAEHLFQTLLHRAFRGELTPQDLEDEPTSVLSEH